MCPFVLSFLYSFIVSSVWIRACVCVCVCLIWVLLVRRWLLKWYKLLSLCSALTLEVNHHNRENTQFMRCKYSIPSILWRPLEGEVKWLSWMMNTKLFSPLPKKKPSFNQCWRCLLSWTHALLLSFYHSNRKCTEYPVHTAGNGQRTQRARQLILRSNMREGKRLGEINNSPLL